MLSSSSELTALWWGRQAYVPMFRAQQRFTRDRGPETPDALWALEHDPVYTQGQAGRAEHVLAPGAIPVVSTDRGGQVTYHGPGQLVIYLLVDCRRRGLGVRALVDAIEGSLIDALASWGIEGHARRDAPGVYVGEAKIASLGLRVRRGCSYHGLALNVAMDLVPFAGINPCGMAGMAVTQTVDLGGPATPEVALEGVLPALASRLGVPCPHLATVPAGGALGAAL